jgi:uncharacterized protein
METTVKELLKQEIVNSLKTEIEIKKLIIFGSFRMSDAPNDIDLAVFQDSNLSYLSLAMKYRKLTRHISKKIPIDIIPVKMNAEKTSFLSEIETGELIYER